MPTVRKLAPEEIHLIENKGKGQRRLVEESIASVLQARHASESTKQACSTSASAVLQRGNAVVRFAPVQSATANSIPGWCCRVPPSVRTEAPHE